VQRDALVHDVACAQIDLGRTIRAFSNYEIEARPQVVERIGNHRPEIALGAVEVLACGLDAAHLAADDNHVQPASSEQATQSSNERALADGRRGALNHEYRCQVFAVTHANRPMISISR
jgi:hypothetical protein